MRKVLGQEQLARLYQVLDTRFGEEDLRTLCFALGVDYDNLGARGKAPNAREFITYLERQGSIQKLLAVGEQLRPDVPWNDIVGITEGGSDRLYQRQDGAGAVISQADAEPQPSSGAHKAEQEDAASHQSGTFTWLHLSDLHIGYEKKGRDGKRLKDALMKDLQAHQEAASKQKGHLADIVFQPHVIFITGDIAYRGAKDEYDKAGELLSSLWDIVGLGSERTFIVPGNHDVERVAVKGDPLYETVYKELADPSLSAKAWREKVDKWWSYPPFRELLEKKFSEYLQFARRHMTVTSDLGYYVKPVVVSGLKVDILGLNSALLSWRDNEDLERGLCIGEPQLDEIEGCLSPDASFRISLIHHPREALHYQDVAWSRLQEIAHFILHGHLHESRVVATAEPQHEHLCLPGGSVYQDGVWHSQRYSYGELDLQTGKLDLYLRMTKPGPYPEYIRDNQTYHRSAPDGHLSINLPQKS